MTASPAYARYEGGVLAIGNALVERRIEARPGAPCRTIALVNKRTGRDYARGPARELALAVDGRALASTDLRVEDVRVDGDAEPASATVRLREGPLALELRYAVHAAHPVVRKRLVVANRGAAAVTLSDLDWEDVELLVGAHAGAEVWVDHFTRREKSVAVTMDDCAILVHDRDRGEGFIVATEAPGPLKRLEVYAAGSRVAAGYDRDDETIFERVLAPGESFATAGSFLLTYASAVPQDAVDGEYAAFVAEHLTACDPARVPSVTVNTWQPFELVIDRALLLEQIDLAADLGADAYQVDAGWYDRMGDWDADPAKFPRGLEEIAARCRERGLRFGLWMAVATVDEASRPAREHPEWLMRDRAGAPNRHPLPGALTMCLDGPYAEVALEAVSRAVARYGVELLKLDLSAVRNVYAPGRDTGCHARGHGHRSARDSHLRILERLLGLVAELRRRHPACLVDVSYELYGVVDGTDLGLTAVADQAWFTNLATPHEQPLRRELYQRGRVVRPWTLNFGGVVLDAPGATEYGLFATLASHALCWGDLRALDEPARARCRRWFAWIKAERARSDFYRTYRVSDVFPVPDGASNRDVRHAVPAARYGAAPAGVHPPAFEPTLRARGEMWDGVARLDERGEGPVLLFRPAASPVERFELRLPWVEAGARYRVEDVTAGLSLGTFDAATLREAGVAVRIATPERAAVLVLRRV